MKNNFDISDSGLFGCLALYLASNSSYFYAVLALLISALCAVD